MNKVLAIVGPTAVGKTALSIQLAHQFNGEIISGDSMQVYKGLDIGTAKVTPAEMDGITHHLINIRQINERFSVADFVSMASKLITDIQHEGKLPIVVGGTGFYLQALLSGLELGGDQYQDNQLRQELMAEANEREIPNFINDLKRLTPSQPLKFRLIMSAGLSGHWKST